MIILNQTNNVDLSNQIATKQMDEAKRKLQESIVTLNRASKNPHLVNLIRKSIGTISFVQTQLEK